MTVGERAGERLRRSPGELPDGERKAHRRDPEPGRRIERRHEQAEALAHAHRHHEEGGGGERDRERSGGARRHRRHGGTSRKARIVKLDLTR
ncbi:MAG: hypothetical protein RML56_02880 [Burkholderiales bacterium]|nr:hypothetical protein [Burkholderiales bacterium]